VHVSTAWDHMTGGVMGFFFYTVNCIDLKENLTEHGRRFDGTQVPASGREKKKRTLQNGVYKHGELLLCRGSKSNTKGIPFDR